MAHVIIRFTPEAAIWMGGLSIRDLGVATFPYQLFAYSTSFPDSYSPIEFDKFAYIEPRATGSEKHWFVR